MIKINCKIYVATSRGYVFEKNNVLMISPTRKELLEKLKDNDVELSSVRIQSVIINKYKIGHLALPPFDNRGLE